MPKIGKLTVNKSILIAAIVVAVLMVTTFSIRFFTPEDEWLCEKGTWTRHGNPKGEMPTIDCSNN